MELTAYGSFSQTIHQRYGGRRVPLEASLEVTRRCPLECLHCYNNLSMADQQARARELSLEEYRHLLDELAEMGVLWLLFSGGEIFARKDFLDIYTSAKKKGFLITLFTNGTMITEKIADYLKEWPPFAIEITLYGHTRETYEALTAIPGSYDRCIRGIKLLRDRGLPLKLKTVPTTINKHEVLDMKRFVQEELGLEFKFDSLISPRIDCSQSPLAVRLSPEEVVALDLHAPETVAEYRQLAAKDLSGPAPPPHEGTVYTCGGGVNAFAVDPYGHMSICVLSHRETYDIRSGSVKDGWEHFLQQVRTRKRQTKTKCTNCRLRSLCSTCPASGELENGDPESPVEFLCEVAHLRALALGHEVPEHGACEYCAGGVHHEAARESAKRIASKEIDASQWSNSPALLPILSTSSPAAGCGGCGSYR
ncbi:MAG: radical SAM protein [Acidobacteria bacterium]|nr:radical SAM protein [Acidobacteriota bacterium]